MDVGQPLLTNMARKENIWLEKGRDLRRVAPFILGQIPSVDTSVIVQG